MNAICNMISWLFRRLPSLLPQRRSVTADLRAVVSQMMEHSRALIGLFGLELSEYLRKHLLRLIFFVAALFCLLIAYMALWALLVVLMAQAWSLSGALIIFLAFHLVVGTLLLLICKGMKIGPLAPATCNEIQTDLECLRLTLINDKNS